jgi:hypothetical protein
MIETNPSNEDALLKAYLAERDVPCRLCGYNLRGLQRATCPECKQALILGVTGAEEKRETARFRTVPREREDLVIVPRSPKP